MKSIGIDIVKTSRIANLFDKWGDRFLEKIGIGAEHIKSKRYTYEHLAGIFAAKEATFKALSAVGIKTSLKDIKVVKENGKPMVKLPFRIKNKLSVIGANRVHISISHEREFAVAVAIIS